MRPSSFVTFAVLVSLMCCARTAAVRADEDVDRALAAVRAQAAAGDAVAQFSLGAFLYFGSTDTSQAIEWIRKAAAQQHPAAEFHMGQVHDYGFGVEQSDSEALVWYRKAAEHGSAAAQRALGDCYQKGRAVKADAAEAARWYRLGADGDDLRAQYHLGQMYLDGNGVARDTASAYMWFAVAAGQTPLEDNRKEFVELRNIAAARMTPEAVAEADRRVASWRPRPEPSR